MWTLVLTAMVAAQAEEPVFVDTEEPGTQYDAPEADLSAEIGGTLTSGNAVFYTVYGAANGAYKWRKQELSASMAGTFGSAIADANADGKLDDDERNTGMVANARRIGGEARFDRFFGNRSSLYLLGGALHAPFTGFKLRSHEQLGYALSMFQKTRTRQGPPDAEGKPTEIHLDTKLSAEIGLDYAQELYVAGVDPGYRNIVAGRLFLGFTHAFNPNVSFVEEVEVFENLLTPVDVRVLNHVGFAAKLTNVFSVKLSHQLTFDNQPVEGFRPLDHTALVTMVASLL